MDVTGIVAMVGLAVLVVLAGRVGAVCGRARARAAAGRRSHGVGRHSRGVGRHTPARGSRPHRAPTNGTLVG